jgi:hypothetical protein
MSGFVSIRFVPIGYHVEQGERVPGVEPDMTTRFQGRARRRANALNSQRLAPTYAWVVVPTDGKWAVVAVQLVLRANT